MIEKNVRRFLARRSVAGMKDDGPEQDGNIITAGVTYIEIRPNSGILRPEDAPIATYGLSLDVVKEHGGVKKYFDELEEIPFRETKYFEEYIKFWENDIQSKYRKIRESLKELNNFSHMVGKPQYGLREVTPASPLYDQPASHDFEMEGGEEPETENNEGEENEKA